ncbi:MAG: HAMP domain-containing protein, partial [Limnobacter sp.]|nr:HAMP domain-containing protein [Limnobacter sp.]
MSFKWKWVLASFGVQLLVGVFFVITWYLHFHSEVSVRQESEQLQLDQLVRLYLERNQGALTDLKAKALLQETHELLEPQQSVLLRRGQRVASMGDASGFHDEVSWIHQLSRLHGVSTLMLSANIPKSEWSIQVIPKYTKYFGRRDWAVETVLGLTMISSLASSMMLLALGNLMIGRLFSLRDKALALQAGQPGVRVNIKGSDEIATLGKAFNDMAVAIENNLEKVKAGKNELEVERNRLDTILSSLSTGIAYLDGQSRVQYVNKALAKMCGITHQLHSNTGLQDLLIMAGVGVSQKKALAELLRDNLYAGRAPVELELSDGRVLKLRFYVANESARNEHGVLMVDDISLHKNVRDLQEEIETDPLTRVMNRRGFEVALDRRIPKLLGEDQLGLIYIDLDG